MFAPFDPDADRRQQGFLVQGPQLIFPPFTTTRPGHQQPSLLNAIDLPTIPSPTTVLPFLRDRFHTLRHRRELPRLPPGQTCLVRGITVARSRVRHLLAGSPTGLAEASSFCYGLVIQLQLLSTLPHGSAVTFVVQAGNVRLRGTFTLLINGLHRRTSSLSQLNFRVESFELYPGIVS